MVRALIWEVPRPLSSRLVRAARSRVDSASRLVLLIAPRSVVLRAWAWAVLRAATWAVVRLLSWSEVREAIWAVVTAWAWAVVRLVVSATNDPEANATLAALARGRGIWVNAVDDPASCDALFASTFRRGPWTVALSTGGAFAGLSRSLRLALEDLLPAEDEALFEELVDLRSRLRTRIPEPAARSAALRGLLKQFEQTYFGLSQGASR